MDAHTFGMRSNAHSNSSNAYANGANQNCGNFITDRTTSRVMKPPGGGSSISFGDAAPAGQYEAPRARRCGPPPTSQISFGGYEEEPVQQQTTYGMRSNAHSNSSNAYANGANQNCGNFITDRTTSRVLKAPGGGSSISFGDAAPAGQYEAPRARRCGPPPTSQISFGGYEEEPVQQQAPGPVTHGMRSNAHSNSSNAFANGANQNCGNFITDRTTSRVLKAPGGGSSISFGDAAPAGQYEAPRARRCGPPPTSQISFGGYEEEPVQQQAPGPVTHGMRSNAHSNSSNAYANGNNQNVGNFITDRPTYRVLKPPGGGSSISFGGEENMPPAHPARARMMGSQITF